MASVGELRISVAYEPHGQGLPLPAYESDLAAVSAVCAEKFTLGVGAPPVVSVNVGSLALLE